MVIADTSEITASNAESVYLTNMQCMFSFILFFCYKLEKENITEMTGLSSLDLCQTPGFNTHPGQSMLEVFSPTKHQRL